MAIRIQNQATVDGHIIIRKDCGGKDLQKKKVLSLE